MLKLIDRIFGMDDIIEHLCDKLDFLVSKDWKNTTLNFTKGCVLVGHPGCGKSMLTSALIEKYVSGDGVRMITGNKGSIGGKSVSEVTKSVTKFFQPIYDHQETVFIVIIDEIDEVLTSKTSKSVLSTELTTAFNMHIQGVSSVDNFYVIGTTNHPQRIDQASIRSGRLDDTLYIRDPEFIDRKKLIEYYISPLTNLDICVWDIDMIQKAALSTPGFNGSDFNKVAANLYLIQSKGRHNDHNFILTSGHVFEEIAKLSLLKTRQRAGFKDYWIDECECIDTDINFNF